MLLKRIIDFKYFCLKKIININEIVDSSFGYNFSTNIA